MDKNCWLAWGDTGPWKKWDFYKQGLLWQKEFTQLLSLHIYARDSQLLVVHMKLCSLSLSISHRWGLQWCRQLLGLSYACRNRRGNSKEELELTCGKWYVKKVCVPLTASIKEETPNRKCYHKTRLAYQFSPRQGWCSFNVTLTKAFWRLAYVVVLPQLLSFPLHLKRKKPLIRRSKRWVKAGSPHLQ